METCFNYYDRNTAFFSSDEGKWIRKIRKLKEQHPDKITILAEPETNDGCIYCKLPVSALKIQLPRTLTEEEKLEIADRLKKAKDAKNAL